MYRMVLVKCRKIINGKRYLSSFDRSFREVSIKVPWGYVRGKWWEPYNIRPVLSMHGWQDNCATFDRLIPLLNKNVGFLAIDYPGHGYSSRLPYGVEYPTSIYTLTIMAIQYQLNWPKVSLMGHSLGGVTSYIYSMLFGDKVDFAVCIDASKPMVRPKVRERFADGLEKFFKYNAFAEDPQEPPSYTLEEIKNKISEGHRNSVAIAYSGILAERNIEPSKLHPGKFYFTRDPRLKISIPGVFSQSQLLEEAKHMKLPIFIAKAKESSYYEEKENFYEVLNVLKRTSVDCDFHYVEGTHHTHLNNPEYISDLISEFIMRHNTEDRTIGGIKDDIIVD